MNEPQDSELFAAWAGGDRAAGATLVERHYGSIERFFATKVAVGVDDLVQQTFLACAEAAPRYRGEGSFRGFLFGIARNMLYGYIRRKSRDGRDAPDFTTRSLVDLAPGVATVVAQEAAHRQLVRALHHIPLDLQILLELYYWEELSVDELARTLEVPPGTIKSRLFRARGALREAIENLPATPDEREGARTMLRKWLEDVRDKAPEVESPAT